MSLFDSESGTEKGLHDANSPNNLFAHSYSGFSNITANVHVLRIPEKLDFTMFSRAKIWSNIMQGVELLWKSNPAENV